MVLQKLTNILPKVSGAIKNVTPKKLVNSYYKPLAKLKSSGAGLISNLGPAANKILIKTQNYFLGESEIKDHDDRSFQDFIAKSRQKWRSPAAENIQGINFINLEEAIDRNVDGLIDSTDFDNGIIGLVNLIQVYSLDDISQVSKDKINKSIAEQSLIVQLDFWGLTADEAGMAEDLRLEKCIELADKVSSVKELLKLIDAFEGQDYDDKIDLSSISSSLKKVISNQDFDWCEGEGMYELIVGFARAEEFDRISDLAKQAIKNVKLPTNLTQTLYAVKLTKLDIDLKNELDSLIKTHPIGDPKSELYFENNPSMHENIAETIETFPWQLIDTFAYTDLAVDLITKFTQYSDLVIVNKAFNRVNEYTSGLPDTEKSKFESLLRDIYSNNPEIQNINHLMPEEEAVFLKRLVDNGCEDLFSSRFQIIKDSENMEILILSLMKLELGLDDSKYHLLDFLDKTDKPNILKTYTLISELSNIYKSFVEDSVNNIQSAERSNGDFNMDEKYWDTLISEEKFDFYSYEILLSLLSGHLEELSQNSDISFDNAIMKLEKLKNQRQIPTINSANFTLEPVVNTDNILVTKASQFTSQSKQEFLDLINDLTQLENEFKVIRNIVEQINSVVKDSPVKENNIAELLKELNIDINSSMILSLVPESHKWFQGIGQHSGHSFDLLEHTLVGQKQLITFLTNLKEDYDLKTPIMDEDIENMRIAFLVHDWGKSTARVHGEAPYEFDYHDSKSYEYLSLLSERLGFNNIRQEQIKNILYLKNTIAHEQNWKLNDHSALSKLAFIAGSEKDLMLAHAAAKADSFAVKGNMEWLDENEYKMNSFINKIKERIPEFSKSYIPLINIANYPEYLAESENTQVQNLSYEGEKFTIISTDTKLPFLGHAPLKIEDFNPRIPEGSGYHREGGLLSYVWNSVEDWVPYRANLDYTLVFSLDPKFIAGAGPANFGSGRLKTFDRLMQNDLISQREEYALAANEIIDKFIEGGALENCDIDKLNQYEKRSLVREAMHWQLINHPSLVLEQNTKAIPIYPSFEDSLKDDFRNLILEMNNILLPTVRALPDPKKYNKSYNNELVSSSSRLSHIAINESRYWNSPGKVLEAFRYLSGDERIKLKSLEESFINDGEPAFENLKELLKEYKKVIKQSINWEVPLMILKGNVKYFV
ncbi:MAG: hypothetical protein MK033_11630 [Candidatus Caenarcaniphilales bacterium]|nr:hypothetical protein [Candidatus Caenarcaniphilales bacterium]